MAAPDPSKVSHRRKKSRPQRTYAMEFSVRALRAWAVPYAVPVSGATAAFADSAALQDEMIQLQLRTLGAEVVRSSEPRK
jgi:hypothetical protein